MTRQGNEWTHERDSEKTAEGRGKFPARIHVLLASHAPVGVVIRRGPSRHVATVLWDRARDRFELGQWFHGRIYERRSDLSPDGEHLIYFAMNGKWDSESKGAWTAISRAPYLEALAMFPKGNCWHGGGLWTKQARYWLNDSHGHSILRDTHEVEHDLEFQPAKHFGGECLGVYYPRLLRDGWQLGERIEDSKWKARDVFHKALPHGWSIRKIAHSETGPPKGKGCYWDAHQLVHAETGAELDRPDWEWAEVDGQRLVWSSGGRLFGGTVEETGVVDEVEIFDFNPMEFEAMEAPY